MTITFTALLLGLVLGVQPVKLEVGANVAQVELLLDGELVGARTEPPWEISCDFGKDLEPHELLAVAHDAAGAEVGRARQWINFPGAPSAQGKSGSERTAVAIEVDPRSRTLDLQALSNRFTVQGRPVEPTELDKGLAEVVVVMDREAQAGLRRIADLPQVGAKTGRSITEAPIDRSIPSWPHPGDALSRGRERPAVALAGREARLRSDMRLEEGQVLTFLWPHRYRAEEAEDDAVHPPIFERTRGLPSEYGGVLWLLANVHQPLFAPREQRLADAVAAAGMAVAAGGRRRAVVLILGERPSDASRISPPAVRRYLQDIGVPLYVWSVGPVPSEVAKAWGGVLEVPKKKVMRRAVSDLSKRLEAQRIVWLDGVYLPQKVVLEGATESLHLVHEAR